MVNGTCRSATGNGCDAQKYKSLGAKSVHLYFTFVHLHDAGCMRSHRLGRNETYLPTIFENNIAKKGIAIEIFFVLILLHNLLLDKV